jgi:hypothetical protein
MGQPAAAPFVSMVRMPATGIFDTLIAETRDLDSAAGSVQGDQELVATMEDVEVLIVAYQDWYACALGVLPQEFREKFSDLFESGSLSELRASLEGPGRGSSMFNPEAAALFPYWEYPFETTFHSTLLEQRQILTLAKQVVQQDASLADLDLVERLGPRAPTRSPTATLIEIRSSSPTSTTCRAFSLASCA